MQCIYAGKGNGFTLAELKNFITVFAKKGCLFMVFRRIQKCKLAPI